MTEVLTKVKLKERPPTVKFTNGSPGAITMLSAYGPSKFDVSISAASILYRDAFPTIVMLSGIVGSPINPLSDGIAVKSRLASFWLVIPK